MGSNTTDTKQKLIDTALELIWKSSYGAVSVDDICRAADVRKGSFYHFFPSKTELALAAMDEDAKRLKGVLDEVFSASRAPLARFERFADSVCESQEQAAAKYGHVCGCPCASLGSEMAGQDCGVREKFQEIGSQKARYFESALRDLVAEGSLPATTDVKAKAQDLFAYVAGQVALARIQNDLGPLKQNLKKGILQLLGAKGTATQAA